MPSQLISGYKFETRGAGGEGRGEQRRGLRTKTLMQDLGTRLEC